MTPPGDIRLLLTDVDGTLVPHDKVLSQATIEAAHDLRAAGIALAVSSARPPRGCAMLVEPLQLTMPIAGFNGGVLANPDLSVIATHPIEPSAARATVTMLEGMGLDVWVYDADAWFVHDPKGAHVDREAWILKFGPTVVKDFSGDQLDKAIKIVGVSDDHALVARCEQAAQKAFGDTLSATRSEPHFLDVTDPKATKGFVVTAMAERLGIRPDQVATIGDGVNDVLMFRASGFSIAMGNAADLVKAAASAVTDSNENDGWAKAVRKYLLPAAARRIGASA